MRLSRAAPALAATALLSCAGLAAAEPQGGSAQGEDLHRQVEAMFAPYAKAGGPGVSVGIYHRGKIDFLGGYGFADLEQRTPITPDTRFHVASVSKQFAAFSVALLAREGRIDLGADIRRSLPYVPDFGKPITPLHLIHHTSGLRDQWALFELGGQDYRGILLQQQVIGIVSRQRGLNFEPGSEYSYSNTGYTLLAELVRQASGRSFRAFTSERIFRPLGMSHSFFYDDLQEVVPGRAQSYHQGDPARPWRRALLNMETYGATSLLTTAEDLLKWAANLAHPAVADAALVSQITKMGALDDGSPINYAFGLRRDVFGGYPALSHTGHDAGFNAVFACFAEQDFAVVLLANQGAPLFPHLDALARLYLGKPAHPAGLLPAEVKAGRALLDGLQGDYLADYGALVSLVPAQGGLVWQSPSTSDDRPGQKLVFRADGTFDLGGRTRGFSEYRVRKDARGHITGFDLISNVGGRKVTPYRRAVRANPSPSQLAAIAGDYYSPELDITYTLSVESDALVARSIWTEAPIAFGPSIADRFDARDGRLPTIVIERDAAGRAVALRIMAEYLRNVRLERRADVRPGPMITASTPPRHSPAPRGVRGADRDSAGNGVGR